MNNFYLYAIDSSYLRGVAQDTDLNLRNLNDGKEIVSKEYEFINLQSASYLVNENFLNVTLWTKSLDKLTSGNLSDGNVTYGILINSDPSSNTGKDGVDYQFEIKLNNKNKQIAKELEEISNEGYTKRIKTYNEDYNKILEEGNNFINLDLGLKDILSPEVFKVLFYAIYEDSSSSTINNTNYESFRIIDYLRWVNIPPPEVNITFKPEPINLIQGKDEIITIFANSKSVSDIFVHFYIQNQPKDLDINFSNNYIVVPSNGEEFVEVNLKSHPYTIPKKATLKLVSEIQFPNENIAYFSNLNNDNIEQSSPEQKYLIKNKVEKISTLIPIEITEYNIVDEIYKTWEKLGGFLTFIYVPLVALLPWMIKKIRVKAQNK
jgi:hypothetical protein